MTNLEFFCCETKLFCQTYYAALPLFHGFLLHHENELWIEMQKWCRKVLNKRNSWPDLHSPLCEAWYDNNHAFWFRNSLDRDLFLEHFNKEFKRV